MRYSSFQQGLALCVDRQCRHVTSAYTLVLIDADIQACMRTRAHACTHTHTRTQARMNTHECKHKRTQSCEHTKIHTLTHTLNLLASVLHVSVDPLHGNCSEKTYQSGLWRIRLGIKSGI